MSPDPGPRFYAELAEWWPLFSPPSHYVEEASDLLARLSVSGHGARPTLLELGSGGGSLAFHLASRFDLTLTDPAPGMLAESRRVNPSAEHIEGDMRTLRLGRTFDVVLLHDAVMYMTTPEDLRAALDTAATHCRPGGTVAVLPDFVRETFEPGLDTGGEDGPDGRAFRYLAWTRDPVPADTTYHVDYAFLLQGPDGRVTVEHDRHVEGLFARADWLRWLAEAGLPAEAIRDPWNRDIFIARRV